MDTHMDMGMGMGMHMHVQRSKRGPRGGPCAEEAAAASARAALAASCATTQWKRVWVEHVGRGRGDGDRAGRSRARRTSSQNSRVCCAMICESSARAD